MADDQLRMEAAVVDRFSKPLTDLKRQLGGVKAPNMSPARREFERFREEVRRSTVVLRDGYGQAMSGLGVQSIVGLGAVAAVTAAIRNFAASTGELKALSHETGISIRNFQLLQGVASQFGSSPDAINGGLKQFRSNLYDIRRGVSDLIPQLLRADPTGALLRQLKEGDPNKSLDIVLEYLGKVNRKNPESAGRISEMIFGTRDFARLTLDINRLKRALNDAAQRTPIISDADIKRAEAFNDLLGKMEASARALSMTVGEKLLPGFTNFLNLMDRIVSSLSDGTFLDKAIGKIEKMNEATRAAGAGRELEAARKRLEEFDKKTGSDLPGERTLRSEKRRLLEEDVRRLEQKVKEGSKAGVEEGMKAAIEKMAFQAGGGGGAQIWNASFGGAPIAAANRRYAGGGRFNGIGGEGRGAGGAGGGAAVDPGDMGAGQQRLEGQGAVQRDKTSRAMRVMARLIGHGWTPEAAAAVAGNFDQESGIQPNGRPGDRGTAFGMGQWRLDRIANLKRFAAGRGKEWTDFDTQVDFLAWEAEARRGTRGRWRRETDLYQANIFARDYERYGDNSFGARLSNARRYLQAWRSGQRAPIPRPTAGSAPQSATAPTGAEQNQGGAPTPPETRAGNWTHPWAKTGPFPHVPEGTSGPRPEGSSSPQSWREPGSAFRSAQGAGVFGVSGPEWRGRASLDVHVRSDGRVNTKADGGDLFQDINVNRGRTMAAAEER